MKPTEGPGMLLGAVTCVFWAGACAYFYLGYHNDVIALKMEIPALLRDVQQISDEVAELEYAVACREGPRYLLQCAALPEFRDFQYPLAADVRQLPSLAQETSVDPALPDSASAHPHVACVLPQ